MRRLQTAAKEAVERAGESTATLRRLLDAAAASGIPPEQIADRVARFSQATGATALQDIATVNTRTWSRLAEIAWKYQAEYFAGMMSPSRSADVGVPPAPPSPPPRGDSVEWMWWYQRTVAWSADYQLWMNRVYRALIEQGGELSDDSAARHRTEFVRDRLPAYIADLAGVGIDTFCDLLEVGDGSAHRLIEELLGDPDKVHLTLEISGVAGSTVARTIAIENDYDDVATVHCATSAQPGFEIAVATTEFRVSPRAPQEITVFVTLPEEPTRDQVEAGTVRVVGDRNEWTILILCRVQRRDTAAVSVRVVEAQVVDSDGAKPDQDATR